jgi:drug/metabolite transporter (DMT)-like permease
MSKTAILVWLAALTGTIFISTAATAFAAIKHVDPYIKSAWRTQVTSYCYFFAILFTLKSSKQKYQDFRKIYMTRAILSGVSVGVHYCTWVLSLTLTSVAHSLLFVCSTPLLMVIYYLIRRKPVQKSEIIGVVVGFTGMIVICIEKNSPEGATFLGDMVALVGSVAIGIHLQLSEDLVNKGGFFYLFVVHGVAALTCVVVSLVFHLAAEGAAGFAVLGEVFAVFYTFEGIYGIYLGVCVGFVGNGAFYFMLQYTSPLVVLIVIFFEPITGSIFAWCLGYQSEPSAFTWVGGLIILIGNFIVGVFAKFKTSDSEKVENLDEDLIDSK